MGTKDNICKNCAYAAVRTDTTRFSWCPYICTYPADDPSRHISYKYDNDTCDNFLRTERPLD